MVFAEGVDHALLLVGVEFVLFFLDALQPPLGPFAEVVEIFVARLPLTESHQLDVAHEKFHLIVGGLRYALQQTVGMLIVHVGNVDKGQRVERLGLAAVVSALVGEHECLPGQRLRLSQVAVTFGIGRRVQFVHLIILGGRTSRKHQHRQGQ